MLPYVAGINLIHPKQAKKRKYYIVKCFSGCNYHYIASVKLCKFNH